MKNILFLIFVITAVLTAENTEAQDNNTALGNVWDSYYGKGTLDDFKKAYTGEDTACLAVTWSNFKRNFEAICANRYHQTPEFVLAHLKTEAMTDEDIKDHYLTNTGLKDWGERPGNGNRAYAGEQKFVYEYGDVNDIIASAACFNFMKLKQRAQKKELNPKEEPVATNCCDYEAQFREVRQKIDQSTSTVLNRIDGLETRMKMDNMETRLRMDGMETRLTEKLDDIEVEFNNYKTAAIPTYASLVQTAPQQEPCYNCSGPGPAPQQPVVYDDVPQNVGGRSRYGVLDYVNAAANVASTIFGGINTFRGIRIAPRQSYGNRGFYGGQRGGGYRGGYQNTTRYSRGGSYTTRQFQGSSTPTYVPYNGPAGGYNGPNNGAGTGPLSNTWSGQ